MNEEKEPQEASDFFNGAIEKVQALIQKARSQRLQREETPIEKLIALRNEVTRGERVRQFMASDFWKEDLEPFLRGEASLKPWMPGDPLPLEEVATKYLHSSGKVSLMSRMISQMGAWVRAGEEATSQLKRESEKKTIAR